MRFILSNLPIPLWVEGAGARLGNARQFMQLTEEVVLKFSPLVTVYTGWESKPWYKIIVNLFSHRSCCPVSGWVSLCKPCELIYYEQNVLKSRWLFSKWRKSMDTISKGAVIVMLWKRSEASFGWMQPRLLPMKSSCIKGQ